jgi:NADPH:quinone reductase-like Zn-dependent oxidoreductase
MTGPPYLIRVVVPTLGLHRPRSPVRGMDLAGNVEAVGSTVTRFQPGDEVFGWTDGGSYAEYACAPEDHFAPKPSNLSVAQAAAVPISGFAALQARRDVGQVQAGQEVLVIGAGGWVGSFAVQQPVPGRQHPPVAVSSRQAREPSPARRGSAGPTRVRMQT